MWNRLLRLIGLSTARRCRDLDGLARARFHECENLRLDKREALKQLDIARGEINRLARTRHVYAYSVGACPALVSGGILALFLYRYKEMFGHNAYPVTVSRLEGMVCHWMSVAGEQSFFEISLLHGEEWPTDGGPLQLCNMISKFAIQQRRLSDRTVLFCLPKEFGYTEKLVIHKVPTELMYAR